MADIQVIVVTPESTALETSAAFVALPLYDGEVGIGHNHSPMIGRLGYGEMRITVKGAIEHYYIDGGFVQVANNIVSVLTSRAVPAANVKVEVAQKQLAEALKKPIITDEQLAVRDRLITQARAQLHVASKA
jgi:F-type H+-transporting ATPase subunit epsilon